MNKAVLIVILNLQGGANMLIDTKEIKEVLIKSLQEYRTKSKLASNDVSRSSLDNVACVLENLLVFITKTEQTEEVFDMAKLESKLVQQIVKIEDIEVRRRSSELENELIKIAEALTPEQAVIIDNTQIKYGHLSTKVSQMKKDKKLPESIHVMGRKGKLYIVKKV